MMDELPFSSSPVFSRMERDNSPTRMPKLRISTRGWQIVSCCGDVAVVDRDDVCPFLNWAAMESRLRNVVMVKLWTDGH